MCLGIPVKIKEINGFTGMADFGGIEREVRIELLEDVKPGDWIIMHAGYALSKLSEKDALETLELIEEVL
ncbi:MAG: HypC/HybG/HupF family hydrogenase formation chaperone [Armatimonadota bacterium]